MGELELRQELNDNPLERLFDVFNLYLDPWVESGTYTIFFFLIDLYCLQNLKHPLWLALPEVFRDVVEHKHREIKAACQVVIAEPTKHRLGRDNTFKDGI